MEGPEQLWSGLIHTDGHDKPLTPCVRQEHIPKCLLHRTVVTLRAPVCWGRWGCPPRMKSHEKLQRREEPVVLKHLSGSLRTPYRCTACPGGLAADGEKSSAGGRQLCGFPGVATQQVQRPEELPRAIGEKQGGGGWERLSGITTGCSMSRVTGCFLRPTLVLVSDEAREVQETPQNPADADGRVRATRSRYSAVAPV